MSTFQTSKIALAAFFAAAAALVLPASDARADYDVADDGSWSLSICTGNLGGGEVCAVSGDVSINDYLEWSDFRQIPWPGSPGWTFNDVVSSYVVCNNTSSGYDFTAQVYQDTNLQNEFQDDTLQLPAHACALVDLSESNVASSMMVTP